MATLSEIHLAYYNRSSNATAWNTMFNSLGLADLKRLVAVHEVPTSTNPLNLTSIGGFGGTYAETMRKYACEIILEWYNQKDKWAIREAQAYKPWNLVAEWIESGDGSLYPKGSVKKGQYSQETYVKQAAMAVKTVVEGGGSFFPYEGGAITCWKFYWWYNENIYGTDKEVSDFNTGGQEWTAAGTEWVLYHGAVEGCIHIIKNEQASGDLVDWQDGWEDSGGVTTGANRTNEDLRYGMPGPFFAALSADDTIEEDGSFNSEYDLSDIGLGTDAGLGPGDVEVGDVEEGDYSDYAQCLILTSYFKTPLMEFEYFSQQYNEGGKWWNNRIIPLHVEVPDKFINFATLPDNWDHFFRNLKINKNTRNFEKLNGHYVGEIDAMTYAELGLTTSLRYIYKSPGSLDIQDVELRNNSVESIQGDYLKLELASEARALATSRTNAEIAQLTAGVFTSWNDLETFLGQMTEAAEEGGSLNEGKGFYQLENASVKFEGSNPSTARKDVQVTLKFLCDSFKTFTTTNIAETEKMPRALYSGDALKITLADLVTLPTTNRTINDTEPGGFIRNQYSPNYNRLQMILGSSALVKESIEESDVPKETSIDEAEGGGTQAQYGHVESRPVYKKMGTLDDPDTKDVNEASDSYIKIDRTKSNDLILDLAVIDHNLERDPATGFITFTVNYRGYFNSMISTPACDALADGAIHKKRQSRDKLLRRAANIGCSRNEIKQIMDTNRAITVIEKEKAYSSIIRRLAQSGRLKQTAIDTSRLEFFIKQGHIKQDGMPAHVLPKLSKSGGIVVGSILDSTSDIDSAEASDIQLKDRNWTGDVQAGMESLWNTGGFSAGYDASDIYTKYREGKLWKTYVFHLGDLLDVLADSIYKTGTNKHHEHYKAMNLKFMGSTFTIPNYFDDGEDITRNIMSLPISIDFFKKWFNETVSNKDLLFYPMGTMIKDLIERVVAGLLYETCLSSPTDTPPMFRIGFFTDCRKGEPSPNSPPGRGLLEYYKHLRSLTLPSGTPPSPMLDWERVQAAFPIERKRALFHSDASVPTKYRENYCVIYSMKSMVMNKKVSKNLENDEDHFDNFIPIICYGTNNVGTNYVSDVKFSKTNTPGLREARYFSNSNGSLSLLSNVYDLSFSFNKMGANTFFYPGQVFDFRLLDQGLGNPHDKQSMAFKMGFGGFFMVKSVDYNLNINANDYQITVESKFIGSRQPENPWRTTDVPSLLEEGVKAECEDLVSTAERLHYTALSEGSDADLYSAINSKGEVTMVTFQEAEEQAALAAEAEEAKLTIEEWKSSMEYINSINGVSKRAARSIVAMLKKQIDGFTNNATPVMVYGWYFESTVGAAKYIEDLEDQAARFTADDNLDHGQNAVWLPKFDEERWLNDADWESGERPVDLSVGEGDDDPNSDNAENYQYWASQSIFCADNNSHRFIRLKFTEGKQWLYYAFPLGSGFANGDDRDRYKTSTTSIDKLSFNPVSVSSDFRWLDKFKE